MAKSKKGVIYVVAMYFPAGNVVKQFKENVEKPTLKYDEEEDEYDEEYKDDKDEYEDDKEEEYDDELGKLKRSFQILRYNT